MIYLIAYVVLVACVASTTRLLRDDEITAPWRVKIYKKYGPGWFWNRMLECARCTSVWTASPWTVLTIPVAIAFGAPWWQPVIAAPAIWWASSYHAYLLILKGEN